MRNILDKALAENQLTVSDDTANKLVHFLELLKKWNKAYNLTSITDEREMVYLHIIDSLLVAPHLTGKRFLDIGSGAGLPGIPLAIAYPEQQWVLLDKNNKKTRFQIQAIADLGLNNVQAVHDRAEHFHPDQCFDSILSRAYGTLALFIETSQHLLCKNGMLLAMKGKYPHDELSGIQSQAGEVNVIQLALKGMTLERHLVLIKP